MKNLLWFWMISLWLICSLSFIIAPYASSLPLSPPSNNRTTSSPSSPISNELSLSPTPNPNDDDRKPAAKRNNTCEDTASQDEDHEESDADDDDAEEDEEQDTDDDDDNDNEESTKDQYHTFDAKTKAKLMKKLPLDLKDKKLNICTYDEPKQHIQRPDGAVLDTTKINNCIEKFENANAVLNANGAGSCSATHPGMYCVVHLNCPSPTMDIFDISIVSQDTYNELSSAIVLRYDVLFLGLQEVRDTTKRGFFYWEERKVTPPDLGFYTQQVYADQAIAFLSNLLCLPTSVLYRSSTKSFFYGPPGVTITRPELASTSDHVALINQKPYGASKGHEINVEWAHEYHRVVPMRKITNIDKVKCIVLVEKEGVYNQVSPTLTKKYQCITILTGGSMNRYTVEFVRAIKARDPQDKIPIYTFSDMDLGGIKIAHQLAKEYTTDNINFRRRSLGDYLGMRFKTCWMGVYPTEYHRLRVLLPMSGVYKPMTMSNNHHNEVVVWRGNHQDDIDYAGDGDAREAEIDQFLEDKILFNIQKIPPSILDVQLGTMMDNAICPKKWKTKLKAPAKRKFGNETAVDL